MGLEVGFHSVRLEYVKNLDDKDFINKGDRYDNTPLHISCQKGFINCVRVRFLPLGCVGVRCAA